MRRGSRISGEVQGKISSNERGIQGEKAKKLHPPEERGTLHILRPIHTKGQLHMYVRTRTFLLRRRQPLFLLLCPRPQLLPPLPRRWLEILCASLERLPESPGASTVAERALQPDQTMLNRASPVQPHLGSRVVRHGAPVPSSCRVRVVARAAAVVACQGGRASGAAAKALIRAASDCPSVASPLTWLIKERVSFWALEWTKTPPQLPSHPLSATKSNRPFPWRTPPAVVSSLGL